MSYKVNRTSFLVAIYAAMFVCVGLGANWWLAGAAVIFLEVLFDVGRI